MLSFARQGAEPRLARLAVQSLRNSSSQAKHNAASEDGIVPPTPKPTKRHDPGLEQRRAARLARALTRSQLAEAANKGITPVAKKRSNSSDLMMSATAAVLSGPPGQRKHTPNQHRKPSRRDQTRSSSAPGGTERSRMATSEPGPAEAIMALARREAANRKAARARNANSFGEDTGALDDELVLDPPQFTGPEPISRNLGATLDTVPNLTSCLPPIPAPRRLRKAPKNWVKSVYGGDYSQHQLDTSYYLKGARGLRSDYAKIIIGRNPTIPLGSQQQLIAAVRKVAQEGRPTTRR